MCEDPVIGRGVVYLKRQRTAPNRAQPIQGKGPQIDIFTDEETRFKEVNQRLQLWLEVSVVLFLLCTLR